MAYSTPTDVLKRWPKTTTSALTNDEIAILIQDADAQINATLGRRYAVPIVTNADSSPPLLRNLSATLAMAEVIDRSQQVQQWVVNRFTRVWETLTALADGTFALLDGAANVIAEAGDGVLSTTGQYVPTFGAQPTLAERTDPQRTADESDARTSNAPGTTAVSDFPAESP